jgi:stage IV sporulation protein FB
MKKFRIHYSFFILILFSFFLGLIKEMLLIIFVLMIHEVGHLLFIILFKNSISNIIIYPFGGVINYELKNDYIYKELLITLGGVLFNLIFYIFFKLLKLELLSNINFVFLIVNLIPIHPLDGSRILTLILSINFPYYLSKIICFIISMCFSLVLLIYIILNQSGFYYMFLILFLIRINIFSIIKINKEYHMFLLLKYLKPNIRLKDKMTTLFTYNPIKNIFYGKNTIFNFKTFVVKEEVVLRKYFKKEKKITLN